MNRNRLRHEVPAYVFSAGRAGQVMKEHHGTARIPRRLPRSFEELSAIPALAWIGPGSPKLSSHPSVGESGPRLRVRRKADLAGADTNPLALVGQS